MAVIVSRLWFIAIIIITVYITRMITASSIDNRLVATVGNITTGLFGLL